MGKLDLLKEDIYKQASPICEELGIDIVTMNVHVYNDTMAIQIFADRPTGGIGIEECTALNKRLDKILYEDMKLGDNYTLEVSSPGLDRMLVGYRELRRVTGREVYFWMKEPVNGKREFGGLLKAVREDDIIVEVRGEEWTIPMFKIEKGKQIIN